MKFKTDVSEIRTDMDRDLQHLEDLLEDMTPAQREALASVKTFVKVALRVFAKTNPSKLRDEARTVEISYLLS